MANPNNKWNEIITKIASNPAEYLNINSSNVTNNSTTHNTNIIIRKELTSIIKINVSLCNSLGHYFVPQLGRIYLDMLNLYKTLGTSMNDYIKQNGIRSYICICMYKVYVWL